MSVIPAALLAAGFVFGAASVEAKQTRSQSKSVSKKKATSTKARKPAPVKPAVDRVAVVSTELYGPFVPLEVYDHPRPPCSEHDAVAEARPHNIEEGNPEAEFEEIAVAPPVGPIARVARTLGSLLRPKSAQSTVRPEDVDLSDLLAAGVQIPVEGVDAAALKDSFLSSRGRHRQHLAIDIGAPKGTPVLAAADGKIENLRRERRGGISLYQKDASGQYLLFYCHLSRYVKGIRPGQTVSKGDVIGYVGSTGRVIGGPHLHFSITRLPEDDNNFKAGVAVNPYLLFLAAVP